MNKLHKIFSETFGKGAEAAPQAYVLHNCRFINLAFMHASRSHFTVIIFMLEENYILFTTNYHQKLTIRSYGNHSNCPPYSRYIP